MKKNSLFFVAGLVLIAGSAFGSRVTHTYADGTQEVYYTNMPCEDVHAWVAAHPEWKDIVSCDPEVLITPPGNGTITVNGVKVEVPVIKDFTGWVKPSGAPAAGYITRIEGTKKAASSGGNSVLLAVLAGLGGVALGFFAGKSRSK